METKEYRRKVLKVCSKCGENPLSVASTWFCDDCLEKAAEYSRKRYLEMTDEQRKENWRKDRQQRRSQGKCARCKNMARPDRVLCVQCAMKRQREYERKKYEDQNYKG